MRKVIQDSQVPIYTLYDKYHKVFGYFDDWIVIRTDKEAKDITEIVMKVKGETHIETIDW